MLAHLADNQSREVRPTVEHRHEHAGQLEIFVHPRRPQLLHQVGDRADAFQGIIFALQWNQQAVSGDQHAQCQLAE